MIVFAWLLGWAVHNKVLPNIKFDNALFQNDLKQLVADVTEAIKKNYWLFGGIYAVLGIAALVGPRFFNKQPEAALAMDKVPKPKPGETAEKIPPTETAKTPMAKSAASKTRKIQG
jgi:hypothetical protein